MSDKDGKFTMPAVVPGPYGILAQRTGFLIPRRFGIIPDLNIPPGQNIKDLKIQMTPTSAVTQV